MKQRKSGLSFYAVRNDRGDHWYWRLKSTNGRIIADGSESYSSEAKARQGFRAAAKMATKEMARLDAEKTAKRKRK